jgi:hypothetical protein
MAGLVITSTGKNIVLNRLFKAVPDYTAPSVFMVGTGTTDPTTLDTELETPIAIAGNPTKAIAAGYPLLDESTHQSTIRCILLTTECNGSSLTEFGLFNTDGTRVIFSRIVHTAITKTASVQVVYVEKDIIE